MTCAFVVAGACLLWCDGKYAHFQSRSAVVLEWIARVVVVAALIGAYSEVAAGL